MPRASGAKGGQVDARQLSIASFFSRGAKVFEISA